MRQLGYQTARMHSQSSTSLRDALQEFPSIRFRAKAPGDDAADGRILAASRLATSVYERLDHLQRAGVLPANDTCEFIVLDRWGGLCRRSPGRARGSLLRAPGGETAGSGGGSLLCV